MPNYEKLYHIMFNAATKAVEKLEELDLGAARRILIDAQQAAEEEYLERDGGGE